MTGVICDKRVAAKEKGNIYKRVVSLAMLFGLETEALAEDKRQSWRWQS